MKQSLFNAMCVIMTASAIVMGCTKQTSDSEVQQKSQNSEQNLVSDKNLRMSDADLIDIIQQRNPSYPKIQDVEDLLIDNCRLSSSVLRTLIANSRYPDYMVETFAVLSAPLSSSDLTYLHTIRPTISTTAVTAAASINIPDYDFLIVNLSPRKVMFAKNMIKTSTCTDGCGESEITGQDFLIVDLTSATVGLDPNEIRPCKSTTAGWVCGTPTYVHLVSTDGTNAKWTVICKQSTDHCIPKVTSAL